MPSIRLGQTVIVRDASFGWGDVQRGDRGRVVRADPPNYILEFPERSAYQWRAAPSDIMPVGGAEAAKPKRTTKVLVPQTRREISAVKLTQTIINGPGKWTAVKLESEGCLNREDRCDSDCSRRRDRAPHVGCRYFEDTKVANDFILRELAKHGLAKRGSTPWSYLYAPKAPLVFSRVYTDSETEWTVTLSIEKPEDVLYAPILVDAWNALAKANGNGIDVTASGMHTAFLQGEDGMYPARGIPKGQFKMFDNFARSMRPLLPALYLLGASRVEDGRGVTRSTSPRQPAVSASDKYSAIAYRHGALEFRVFDTCYDTRDQVLDNIVVMAQSVRKYWRTKYVKPSVNAGKVVMFGNSVCENQRVNELKTLYCLKEHVVMLNSGLRCIKPPYLSVKEIKMARRFNLTVRDVKDALDTESARSDYERHVNKVKLDQAHHAASELYRYLDGLRYDGSKAFSTTGMTKFHADALKKAKRLMPELSLEQIAYKKQFGTGFPIGGK